AGSPVLVNHAQIVLSAQAAVRIRPSRPLKATPDTLAPVGVRNSFAAFPFQTRTNPAELPAANHSPSTLDATLVHWTILLSGPSRPPMGLRVAVSQATISPSWPAVTRRRPSGLKATAAR